jgi:tRNA pseudouridine13 synthase
MLRLTQSISGSGGVLRPDSADFEVSEVLAYAPSGAGEHLLLEIEKIDLTTIEAIRKIGDALNLPDARSIGFAGLKDRAAIARQWISVPWPVSREVPAIDRVADQLRVLSIARHANKIRRGHQRANRFRIVIRDVPAGGIDRARASLDMLKRTGVPNAFGPQRFGKYGDNAERALKILRGEDRPPRERRLRELLFSSLQSLVFNRVLEQRIDQGLIARAILGDVMQKHDTGGLFDVHDEAAEQPRVDRLEISPTGPLPGDRTRKAGGDTARVEAEAIAALGLSEREVSALGPGTRRAMRYPLDAEASIEAVGEDAFRLCVSLPSGAYATVLLDEIVQPDTGVFDRGDGV